MNSNSQKPRILIFSLTYFPFIGGAEIAIREITKRLANNFDFDLICARLDKELPTFEKTETINIYRIGWGNKFDKYFYPWLALKKAKKLQRKNNYQISWGVLETWGGWAALKFREKFPLIKYLLTMQSGDTDLFIKLRTWFWWPRYKKIFMKADKIQAISRWLAERARKYGYGGEIEVVPNGVEIIKNQKLKIKSQKEEKIILTVSRLVKKNGIEDLIKAYKFLITHYSIKNIKLVIVGEGKLEKKLKELANQLEVIEGIEFVGKVQPENLAAYYSQADVFVRPSLSEGLGNVFLEAMAAGVPVIATPVGGIIDFLIESETGWFCRPKNPASVAEKIVYILDEKNKANVAQVVTNAQKMVEEKYSWEVVAEKMKIIFDKLISRLNS